MKQLPEGCRLVFSLHEVARYEHHEIARLVTRDDGINVGLDYNLTRSLDLSAGYSRSVYSALNTFSFGIQVNVGSLLKNHSRQ